MTTTINTATTATTTTTLLGYGAFGEVTTLSPGWVVKTPRAGSGFEDEVLRSEYFIYKLLREQTDLVGRIVPALHVSSTEDKLILEHIQGRTLSAICADESVTPYAWGVALLHVGSAIAAFHAAGWIHGDCHPGNVIVNQTGARLIDLSGVQSMEHWGDAAPMMAKEDRMRMIQVLRWSVTPWQLKMAYNALL